MPQIKFDYVVSFSSEDPSSPASNLLSKDIVNKKWVGLEKGASSNSVILQLEKSCQITSMHIGNYHSGFIEVLAGRSEASDQQFEVLLIASSFMTPPDSRNSVNISNVRTFTYDNLTSSARDKKWDRIRVVCTQPYNRHTQFGLSFINVFSSDSNLNNAAKTSPPKQTSLLGKLKYHDSDDENESSFKPGELFARLKKNSSLSTDAQIRNASSPHNINKDSSSLLVKTQRPVVKNELPATKKETNQISPLSRKRDKLLYVDEDDEPNEKIDNIIKKDKEEKNKNNAAKKIEFTSTKTKEITKNKVLDKTPAKEASKNIPSTSHSQSSANNNFPSTSRNNDSSRQKNEESLKRKHETVQTPAEKKARVDETNTNTATDIFRDIVFVISGYANPKRGNIRDIAISLGAKYRPDWGPNCTHLICAFPNTPKHEQVLRTSRSAVVVTAEWIIDCASEKKRLPWEWFATDPKKRIARPPVNLPSPKNSVSTPNITDDDDDDVIAMSPPKVDPVIINDEEDTDDEIEKILQKQSDSEKLKQVKKMSAMMAEDSDLTDIEEDNAVSQTSNHTNGISDVKTEIDPYSVDTESDSESKVKKEDVPEPNGLPDHFSGIKFYIDPNLSNEAFDCDKLKRYVLAFDGELIETWPNPQIDVAITIDKLVGDLRPGKGKKCQFLQPTWIWKCNDNNKLYEFEKYVIK